jgi:heptosyltransferase-2
VKRILILRGGALGDFIVTLPVLAALRRQWPDAELHLAVRPTFGRLALAADLAHAVIPLESARLSRFFADAPEFTPEEAAFVRSLDLAVSFLADGDGVVERNMRRLGLRRWLAVPSRVEQGHATDHFLAPLLQTGLVEPAWVDPVPRLVLNSAQVEPARMRLAAMGAGPGLYAILHPGSGSPAKNWPAEGFLAVARGLWERRGLRPVFLAGEADRAVVRRLRDLGAPYPILEDLDLDEVASLLSMARVYVGNDSGISHLAAALGAPSVVVFGPTDPARWAPRGLCVRVVRSNPATAQGLQTLPSDSVFRNVLDVIEEGNWRGANGTRFSG